MTPESFLKQLDHELDGHPFRDRFLEELKHHAEDLEKEKLKESDWQKRMGKPHSVKQTFKRIMNPFGKLFFVLEGLFFGLMFVPLTLFLYVNMRGSIVFYPNYPLINPDLGIYIFFYLIIGAILSTLYFQAYKRFEYIKVSVDCPRWGWDLLIIGPALVTLFLNFYFELNNEFGVSLGIWQIGVITLVYAITHALARYVALQLGKIKVEAQKGWHLSKVWNVFKWFIFILGATLIVGRTALSYSNIHVSEWSVPYEWLGLLFHVESLVGRGWVGLMNTSLLDVNLFAAFYLPLLFLVFIAGQSLWVMLSQKKWLPFRGLLVIYVFSLCFISSNASVNQPDFEVPVISLSRLIEKEEVGLFYPLAKHLNSSGGALFRYAIEFEKERFLIHNNVGNTYAFDLEQFKNHQNSTQLGPLKVNRVNSNQNLTEELESKYQILSIENWPKDLECESVDDLSGFNYCDQIFYRGKLILENLNMEINDVSLSDNGNWAAFVMSSNSGSEEVYLVQLPQ